MGAAAYRRGRGCDAELYADAVLGVPRSDPPLDPVPASSAMGPGWVRETWQVTGHAGDRLPIDAYVPEVDTSVVVVAAHVFLPGNGAWGHIAETVLPDYIRNSLLLVAGTAIGLAVLLVQRRDLAAAYILAAGVVTGIVAAFLAAFQQRFGYRLGRFERRGPAVVNLPAAAAPDRPGTGYRRTRSSRS